MTPKEKAAELIVTFKIILMNKDTDCGNEILCTTIAKECAKITVNEILINNFGDYSFNEIAFDNEIYCDKSYWNEVLTEIDKY